VASGCGDESVCVNVVVHHNTCIKKENMPTMLFESPQTSYDMQKRALSRKGPISCQIERFGFLVLVSFFLVGLMLAPIS